MLYFSNIEETKKMIAGKELSIAVLGLGRVGLPLAAVLADVGFQVKGIDINPHVVETVNKGLSPYPDEHNLKELVSKAVAGGFLYGYEDCAVVAQAELIIISVPTLVKDKQPDIEAVIQVAKNISPFMNRGKIVVLQSTVPPGTTQYVLGEAIFKYTGFKPGIDFGLAYSPERTQSPQVIDDLKAYPKIVGAVDNKTAFVLSEVYRTFAPSIIRMQNIISAELVKLFENTFRDVNIALANELALLCELYKADAQSVINSANSQPFCNILQPGLVGGHCIPVDPYYLISDAKAKGFDAELIKTSRNLNEKMFRHIVEMIPEDAKRVTVLGLSFKPGVKSFTDSHTVNLVRMLESRGHQVKAHDPFLGNENYICKTETDIYKAICGAECLVLSTAHEQYKTIDFNRVKKIMQGPLVIDVRALWDRETVRACGLLYRAPGRTLDD